MRFRKKQKLLRKRARARVATTKSKELSPIAKLILQRLDERFDQLFGSAHDSLIAGFKSSTN